MSIEDIDVSAWPMLRFGGSSVRLQKGADYVCVTNRFMAGDELMGKTHDHVLTLTGLEKIVTLTDDEDMRQLLLTKRAAMARGRQHEVLMPRDPERVRFRMDHDRLRRIHREGNG